MRDHTTSIVDRGRNGGSLDIASTERTLTFHILVPQGILDVVSAQAAGSLMGYSYSNEPDERVLKIIDKGERFAFAGVGLIVIVILGLWWAPPLRSFAPAIWSKMTASTALAMALSTVSLLWSAQGSTARKLWLSKSAAFCVFVLGALTIAEYLSQKSFGFDLWLPHAMEGTYPGRPSPQTSLGFVLMGLNLLLLRQRKNQLSMVSDLLSVSLIAFVLVLLGGYLYGALELIGVNGTTLTSPHTLICFTCLTFVVAARRARYGNLLAVLVNLGIGSQLVRVLMPVALALPFAFFAIVTYLINARLVGASYATAVAASAEALLIFCIVVWMAWRLNGLERQLRELSLTDELSQINNRRGFYLLAQHAFREAVRSGSGMTVLYLDLDGLKLANDTLGHEAGSQMIRAMAALLTATFRGSDIVGRIGGDEFAICVSGDRESINELIHRLQLQVDEYNRTRTADQIRFSIGSSELIATGATTFDQLIDRADAMMYAQKAAKKETRIRLAAA